MIKPEKPVNEAIRLAALYRYRILDSEKEKSFDDLVTIAKAVCGASMAAVTLIDAERQWFKSIEGVDARELPRSESMCGHAILQPWEVMVVEDARTDVRFHDNPNVTGDPKVRFYAGAPLVSTEGLPLGTLCVFDPRPQRLDAQQTEALAALSRQVMLVMELRRFALDIQTHMVERDDYERLLSEYHDVLLAQNADLAEQSRTDVLTGLPNRRAMAVALDASMLDADGQPGGYRSFQADQRFQRARNGRPGAGGVGGAAAGAVLGPWAGGALRRGRVRGADAGYGPADGGAAVRFPANGRFRPAAGVSGDGQYRGRGASFR